MDREEARSRVGATDPDETGEVEPVGGEVGPDLTGIGDRQSRTYLLESIVDPNKKIVQGYQPLMPSFQGQMTEEQIYELIAYIKSLDTGRSQAR